MLVMPALVAGIHVLNSRQNKDVNGREIGERKRCRSSNGYGRPRRRRQFHPVLKSTGSDGFRGGPDVRRLGALSSRESGYARRRKHYGFRVSAPAFSLPTGAPPDIRGTRLVALVRRNSSVGRARHS
jgi:hypothetical protein